MVNKNITFEEKVVIFQENFFLELSINKKYDFFNI